VVTGGRICILTHEKRAQPTMEVTRQVVKGSEWSRAQFPEIGQSRQDAEVCSVSPTSRSDASKVVLPGRDDLSTSHLLKAIWKKGPSNLHKEDVDVNVNR
jgi:hypothetical protein